MAHLLESMNPTQRFSNRVSDYKKYRPSYPQAILDDISALLRGLDQRTVADVGAGTGIFTRLLLERGAFVFAVEPNKDMAQIAVEDLKGFSSWKWVKGTSESSGLENASVDFISCAQAFHWFDLKKTRIEFQRILKPGGLVGLIWNYIDPEHEFGREYDRLKVELCDEYQKVTEISGKLDLDFASFFGPKGFELRLYDNFQDLDAEGLQGRFFSSSYSPLPESEKGKILQKRLQDLFERFQKGGVARLHYKTEFYFGSLL